MLRVGFGRAAGLVEGQQGELTVRTVAGDGPPVGHRAVRPAAFAVGRAALELRIFQPFDIAGDDVLVAGRGRTAEDHGLQRNDIGCLGMQLAEIIEGLLDVRSRRAFAGVEQGQRAKGGDSPLLPAIFRPGSRCHVWDD